MQRCDVLLAVIGPRWLAAHDEHGRRRLDNDNDLVRNEIALAFQLGKCVIPVLVKDARLPAHDALPEDVRPLSWRKAIPLRHEQFSADCQGLIVRLRVELEKARLKRPGDAHDTPADELTAMREEFAKLAKAHLRLRMLARILSLVVAAETAVLALFGYQGLLRKITGLLQPR